MKNTITHVASHLLVKVKSLSVHSHTLEDVFGIIFAYRKVFVFETNALEARPETESKVEVDVRLAQSGDISKLARFKGFSRREVEKRLEAGDLCFIAETNGNVVYCIWVCRKDLGLDALERKLRIGFDSAQIHSQYTVLEYRGMGIATAVIGRVLDYLFRNGVKRVHGLIYPHNIPPQRVVEKNGFRKIGEVTLVRLFNSKRYRYKGETSKDCVTLKEMFSI